MARIKRWIKYPPIWVTLLLVVSIAAWQVWNLSATPQRMSPALREALAQGEQKLDIAVQVDFKLEPFHLNYFQGQGRVAGVEDHQILLRGMPAEEVPQIASNYWIARILLAEEVN